MKYSLIAVLIILLGLAGLAGYSFMQSSNQDQMEKESMMQDDQSMQVSDEKMMTDDKMATDSDKMMTGGNMMEDKKYLPYSADTFENAESGKRILFFYADWCPTCRPADADFLANMSKIPDGVTLIRVNYNDTETDQAEKDLAKKYGVTYQHTFVQIDAEGNEVTKWNGGKTTELLAKIK